MYTCMCYVLRSGRILDFSKAVLVLLCFDIPMSMKLNTCPYYMFTFLFNFTFKNASLTHEIDFASH